MAISSRAILSLAVLAFLVACEPRLQTDPHAERAHDLMMQERSRAGAGGPDYTQAVWLEVIEDLSQVDPRYKDYEEEMALLEEIKAVRAAAFLSQAQEAARKEEEAKKRERELNEHIDKVLSNPFSPGGDGGDPSEGGRWHVVLERLETQQDETRYAIRGEIWNVSGRVIRNPIVVVDFLDRRGGILGTAQGMIEPSSIPPLAYGRFEIRTRDRGIKSYKLTLRELSGERLTYKVRETEQE